MKRLIDCRALLLAGTAAVAAAGGPLPAQSAEIRGTVAFEGGAAIPKGGMEIYIDDPAVQDATLTAATTVHMESDGGSRTMEFSLSQPERSAATGKTEIVARLERADGWLLARGSAQVEAGSPVSITLYTAMY